MRISFLHYILTYSRFVRNANFWVPPPTHRTQAFCHHSHKNLKIISKLHCLQAKVFSPTSAPLANDVQGANFKVLINCVHLKLYFFRKSLQPIFKDKGGGSRAVLRISENSSNLVWYGFSEDVFFEFTRLSASKVTLCATEGSVSCMG